MRDRVKIAYLTSIFCAFTNGLDAEHLRSQGDHGLSDEKRARSSDTLSTKCVHPGEARLSLVFLSEVAKRAKESSVTLEDLAGLQRVLSNPTPWVCSEQRYRNLHMEANAILHSLPEETKKAYRDLFGNLAESFLKEASMKQDPALLEKVAYSYRGTGASADAIRVLAALAEQAVKFEDAKRYYLALEEDGLLTGADTARFVHISHRLGDIKRRDALLEDLGKQLERAPLRMGDNKATSLGEIKDFVGKLQPLQQEHSPSPVSLALSSKLSPEKLSLPDFVFVRIEPTSFKMGTDPNKYPEAILPRETQHTVTITEPFEIQTTEVTQALWESVMGEESNASRVKGPDLPVTYVSWNDIQEFLKHLNQLREAQGERTQYDLPTEAQWELAARGGRETRYSFGEETDKLEEFAWYKTNSGGKPHKVASLKPNDFGLYDMHGNVSEWVKDSYGDFGPEPKTNPLVENGASRVRRGGGWDDFALYLRSASRFYSTFRGFSDPALGFRLVRKVK